MLQNCKVCSSLDHYSQNTGDFCAPNAREGGNDTPRLRVPAARIFKELPCFGVKFSNIHPASESDFLSGIFSGGRESIVMQISFVMLIFLLFSNQFFWGGANSRGKLLEGKDSVSGTMYQNTEMSCFQRKP